jgi:antitoxin ParD1/3/4
MNEEMKNQMTSMNILVPESMKTFIEDEVSSGGYETASEYVRALVRDAKKQKEEERLEKLLVEAVASGPATPMTKKDWEAIRQRNLERIQLKKEMGLVKVIQNCSDEAAEWAKEAFGEQSTDI